MRYVYVLMDGCIGDYHIVDIYSSKKKAEEAKKNRKDTYDPWIEKWEIK